MAEPQRSEIDVEALRAFVRGELGGSAREKIEGELDENPEARALLGVLAREVERTKGPRRGTDDPYVGVVLGDRYRIRRRIGRGGMGAVYEAEHVLLGRTVALKLLHAEYAERPEVRRRFENEARAVASLEHPNIVRALDVGRAPDGAPFLVFERLEGLDLEARLREVGRLPVARAVDIAIAIADALELAHGQGIVHRDLKPANVFLAQPDDTPKVLDFGVSKLRRGVAGVSTHTGAFMGTPAYMAPEQIRDASDVDARADVYALGVMLFRMLTGDLPHAADGLGALLAAREQGAPSLRTKRPDASVELDGVVQRALAPGREARFASMRALRSALAPFVGRPRAPSVRPLPNDEIRLVTAIFARGADLHDEAGRAGGRIVRSQDHQVAIFGEGSWSTDVLETALRVALAVATDDSLIVVGAARLSTAEDRIEGEARDTYLRAAAENVAGVFVSAEVRPLLGTYDCERRADGLYAVSPSRVAAPTSPLLGRDAEVARLRESWARCGEDGEALATVLEGPPGIGKSRLLEEAVAIARRGGAWVLRARGRAGNDEGQLGLLAALVAHLEDTGLRRDELLHDADEGTMHRRYLDVLLDTAPDVDATNADPVLVADRVRLAVVAVLVAAARVRPLVIAIEDAQWIGGASWRVLEHVLEAGAPVWLLAASRTELPLDGPAFTMLRLRGLRRRDVRSLAEAIRGRALDGPELDELFGLTEGNPFFVDQIARALGDDASPLPPSVEAAIQARLDGLSDQERELLKRVSVLEDAPFGPRELEALGIDDAAPLLDRLRREELLRRGGTPHSHRIAFAPVAATAYAMLPNDVRTDLHRRLAELWMTDTEPAPERVAAQLMRAGDEREAARWLGRAALHAARRGDLVRVIGAGARAIEAGERSFALAITLAEAYELEGRFDEEVGVLEVALEVAEGDDARGRALALLGVAQLRRGRMEDASDAFRRAEEKAREPRIRAEVLGKHAVASVYMGDIEGAARRLGEAERLVLVSVPELRAEAASWRGQIAAATGDLADRRNAYWAAVELYRERGDLRRTAGAAVNLADVYNRLGAYEEAVEALEKAIEDCRRVGVAHAQAYAQLNLAYAQLRLKRLSSAEAALAQVRDLATRFDDPRLLSTQRIYAARLDVARGATDVASIAALANELEESGQKALATLAWGVAAEAKNDVTISSRAIALLDALGTLEEDEASIRLTHARALEAAGRVEEARDVRAQARAAVLATSRRIGDPMWRERFLRDVPAHRALMGD